MLLFLLLTQRRVPRKHVDASLIELQVRARMPLDDRPCVYARAHMGCAIASQRSQKANIFCISHAGC
jgi:hypothetical protein